MKGIRYVGGNRDAKVEDTAAAFLADVDAALAAGDECYVLLGTYCPEEFQRALHATGVIVIEDPTMHQMARLVEGPLP